MKKYFLLGLSIGMLFSLTLVQAKDIPQITVTLKPIHALVSGVMEGIGQPDLLLSGGESPHTYHLKPSQMSHLSQADLVIWVGPAIESFLAKPLSLHSVQQLKLMGIQGLTLLKLRSGALWEEHDHHSSSPPTEDFQFDQHIWLDPHNAQVMVMAIAEKLGQIDAVHTTHYQTNALRLNERLRQLDQSLKKQLTPLKQIPFLVFHDAYQYFENRYGLTVLGVVSVSPEQRPSVRRLHELRQRMGQAHCIFKEPQFESALITTLLQGTSTRLNTLDPLGMQLEQGTEAYFKLLHNLGYSLRACLVDELT